MLSETFELRPDLFGPDGPGSRPDFLSDDYLRVRAVFVRNGKTFYARSPCFQIKQRETFRIEDLEITDAPPIDIEALRAVPDAPTLNALGQTTQVRLLAKLSTGAEEDITEGAECVTFRSSNRLIAAIDGKGVVTARGGGLAFITAVVDGVTAVTRVLVVPGDLLTTGTPPGVGPLHDGDRVEVEIDGIGTLSNSCVTEP